MDLHVFPILIPSSTFLPIPSLWVFPVHQPGSLVSCIQPGLVISFTLDNIHVSMLFSQIIPPLSSAQSPKVCSIHLCLFFCLAYRVIITIFLNSIYVLVYCIGVHQKDDELAYFTLYNGLQFHPSH